MSQKTILSFFKPQTPINATKRSLSTDKDASPAKRVKVDDEDVHDESGQGDVHKDIKDEIRQLAQRLPALSENIGISWYQALKPEFNKPYFKTLSAFIDSERKSKTIYPPRNEIFSWTQQCPIKEVKVVILGQDPYHDEGQAHGLCFSVKKGVRIPPSLHNIYKEVTADIPGFKAPSHGNLTGWAKQGVLLLNAVLTVRAHNANSHADHGWEKLTDAVIKWLNDNLNGLVFILWGGYAQKKSSLINQKKHLILQSAHPSPLSASRGFIGCKHFSQTNDYLTQHGKGPIDWKKLD